MSVKPDINCASGISLPRIIFRDVKEMRFNISLILNPHKYLPLNSLFAANKFLSSDIGNWISYLSPPPTR